MSEHRSPLGIFLACFLVSLSVNAYIIAPASIVPLLRDHFAISTASVGVSISAAVLGAVLVQLPGGFLMDRYDNRWLLVAALCLYVPVAAVGTATDSYAVFLVSRAVAGLGAGGLFVVSTNVVADVFAGRRQGFLTTLLLASAPVGYALSQFGGPPLGAGVGWAAPFLVGPLLAALGLVVFVLSRPAPIRSGDRITVRQFRLALGNRAVLLVSAAGFCSYLLYIFLNAWMPSYAAARLPMTLPQAGAVSALLPAMGVIARPAGGWLSDRLGSRRRAIVLASLAMALPVFVVLSRAVPVVLFAGAMLWVGFALQFGMGVYYVYVRELASPATTGTSLTLFTAISFLGTLSAPPLGGWLVETLSWGPTFAVHIGIGVVGLVLVLLAPRTAPTGRP
ncbi:MAG: nitrate/nitrite transporter [Halorientalis sp.]